MTPIKIIIAGAAIAIAGFAATVAFGDTRPVIRNDMGGSIEERIETLKGLDGVVIDGKCYSACTFFLSLPETCITKRAKLGFHSPYYKMMGRRVLMMSDVWEVETQRAADHYPPQIAKWYLDVARHDLDITVLNYKQAVKMGVKPCRDK